MQVKNSSSHKYFLNSNINFEIQIYIYFITEILIFRFGAINQVFPCFVSAMQHKK
jgi:hypothetical protein